MSQTCRVTFYFDPICPFAYKTSLWIREVRNVRSLEIDWRFFSLRAVNEGTENLKEAHGKSLSAFRVMALGGWCVSRRTRARAREMDNGLGEFVGGEIHEPGHGR